MKSICSIIVLLYTSMSFADCGSEKVKVYTPEPQYMEAVCENIQLAKDFFEKMNIDSDVEIELHVMDKLKKGIVDESINFERTYGFVHPDSLVAYMASWKTLEAQDKEFHGVEFKKEHYFSIIAHEIGHIISIRHYQKLFNMNMPIEQSEYLSYAMQLEVMPPDLRNELVDNFKWPVFETHDEINQGYHAMNPHGFAIKSYLYYNSEVGYQFATDVLMTQVPENEGFLGY